MAAQIDFPEVEGSAKFRGGAVKLETEMAAAGLVLASLLALIVVKQVL